MKPDFWHGPVPAARLGRYRLMFGLLLFGEVLSWLPDSRELFSNAAFHPPGVWAPSPALAPVLVLCLAASCLFFAVGIRTKPFLLSALLLWNFLTGVDLTGERAIHTIAQVIMAVLLFSDCGRALSLDALLRRRRGLEVPALVCAFPLRLLQLEIAQVYFFSGLHKLAAGGWADGAALSLTLRSRWATDAGFALGTAAPPWLLAALGTATLAFELGAPVLLFTRFRPWAVGAGILFHLGIQTCLFVGSLGAHFLLALPVLFLGDFSAPEENPSLTKAASPVIN